jgi:hypothetical protein
MRAARPTVTTAYGGPLDFADPQTAHLIRWAPVPVGPGAAHYPASMAWAEPDLDAAAAALRALRDDPDAAQALGARAATAIAHSNGPEHVGDLTRAALFPGRTRSSAASV